jgi:hypothetical protein
MAEAIRPTWATAEQQVQIARLRGVQESLFQRHQQVIRHTHHTKTGAHQRVSFVNEGNRVGCRDNFGFHTKGS